MMAKFSKDKKITISAINEYAKKISNGDHSSLNYLTIALLYQEIGKFEEALKNIEMISGEEEPDQYYYHKGLILYKQGKYKEAIDLFYKILKMDSEWDLEAVKCIISSYIDSGKYDEAYIFHMNEGYEEVKGYENLNIEDIRIDDIRALADHYIERGKYTKAKKVFTKFTIFPYIQLEDWEQVDAEIQRINDIRRKQDVESSKVQERDRILSNLSHSIKNLISTIIDPLSNLHEEKEYKDVVVENALKGADLIREIVNAMNLSYKGSIKDFQYDAKHNESPDCLSMNQIIIESLKHSVSNMFDSKYFGNFMRNYFSNKNIYSEAKNRWNKTTSLEEITQFVRKYMFDFNMDIHEAKDLSVGNEKGSAIKFQILFQEIILNAVKYVSFLEREKRLLSIELKIIKGKVVFKTENSYQKGQGTKSTGLGHIIIENFAKLLNTKPEIKQNGNYVVSISFRNLWINPRKDQK